MTADCGLSREPRSGPRTSWAPPSRRGAPPGPGRSSGDGPTLVIANTYRIEGHTIGDPLTLRPKGETDEWRQRDPILRLWQTLREQNVLDDDAAEKIVAEANREIDGAVDFALSSPEPAAAELWKDVY